MIFPFGIGKQKVRGGNDVSVTFTDSAKSHNGKYVGFTFRNDCYKKFAPTSPYFEIAFYKNRMFIKESDSRNGILLQTNRDTPNRYGKIQNEKSQYFAHWSGDYKLEYDEFWELYYIERKDEE